MRYPRITFTLKKSDVLVFLEKKRIGFLRAAKTERKKDRSREMKRALESLRYAQRAVDKLRRGKFVRDYQEKEQLDNAKKCADLITSLKLDQNPTVRISRDEDLGRLLGL